MSLVGRALSLIGLGSSSAPAAQPNAIQARFDNAQTTPENARNWFGADYLSAKAANSFQVRRQLRIRSRHEVSNNPFLFGICNNNADDLISTGPTLQVRTGNATFNRTVERSWAEWCDEIGLVEKIRTCKLAKTVDGEGFLILKTVTDMEHPVKLYPCDIEADQVTTYSPKTLTELWVDGLTLHPITGRPTAYHVLKSHPGDFFFPNLNPLALEEVSAKHVIHWFPKFRPGQVRGVPVFTSSLDLFTELRAYRRACLGAAEIAADFAAVLEAENSPADTEDTDAEYEAFKRVPINRKMMTLLPAGMKMNQFEPKQPVSGYDVFQATCLGEACRPLSYPLNLALGSSQKFNFSSSKLDHINYRNGLSVERADCERVILTHLFRAWFLEAILPDVGAVPMYDRDKLPPIEWHWPGFESLDPVVDAQADHERLSHGTLTYREFWARRGYDWKDVMQQQHVERLEMTELELVFGDPLKQTATETTTEEEPANAA